MNRHDAPMPRDDRTRTRSDRRTASWRRFGLMAKSVLLTGFVTGAFLVGTTQAAFTDGDANGTNQFQAGYWVPEHVSLVGTASCAASTTDVVTVTAPIPAGNTLIVRMATRDGSITNPTAADNRGNSYQRDAFGTANQISYAIFSAPVTIALSPGDTITVTHAAGTTATFVRADVFSGVAIANRVFNSAIDSGNAKKTRVRGSLPVGNALVVAGIGIQDPTTVTSPGGWTLLDNAVTACGTGLTSLGGYQITTTGNFSTFDPAWSAKQNFSTAVVVYLGE